MHKCAECGVTFTRFHRFAEHVENAHPLPLPNLRKAGRELADERVADLSAVRQEVHQAVADWRAGINATRRHPIH